MCNIIDNFLIIVNNLLIFFTYMIACNNPNIKTSKSLSNTILLYYGYMSCMVNVLGIHLLYKNDILIYKQFKFFLIFCSVVNTLDFTYALIYHYYLKKYEKQEIKSGTI